MDYPDKDGKTLREHMMAASKTEIKLGLPVDDRLNIEFEMSSVELEIKNAFFSLNRKRTNNGYGYLPISNSEIYYWQKNHYKLNWWQIEILELLDGIYLNAIQKVQNG